MKERRSGESTLAETLDGRRIVVCAGAGGVGKTTLAAAIAVMTARKGKNVVCLTIDPARRLADSLGVPPNNRGQISDITDILGPDKLPGAKLSFGMLDPRAEFARIVRQRASSKEAAERILKNKLYRYISGSLSGMQEYMALEQLFAIRNQAEVELIVLDTPPTMNAIDFFTAPRRIMEALDGRLVRIMRRAYGGATRAGFDIWSRWAGAVLKTLARFTGQALLSEIMGFIDALSDLFGSFAERAETVERVLHGNDVCFCLVSMPDRATLRETRDFRNRLSAMGLAVDAMLFNRVHWPRADEPPADIPAEVADEIRRMNTQWNRQHDMEMAFVDQVRKSWEELDTIAVVPLLSQGASRIAALDQLAEYF